MFLRPHHFSPKRRTANIIAVILLITIPVIIFLFWLYQRYWLSAYNNNNNNFIKSSSLENPIIPSNNMLQPSPEDLLIPNILNFENNVILKTTTNGNTPSQEETISTSTTATTTTNDNNQPPPILLLLPEHPNNDQPPASSSSSSSTTPNKPHETFWFDSYSSPECQQYRQSPVGRASAGEVGLGRRSLCLDRNVTLELKKEIEGSVDISISHRAIYIPVMKAGTQMFAEVFKRRFGGVRVRDRDVTSFIKRHGARLGEFFVFTFVRNPFSMFRSAYGEVSLYAAHSKISHSGFALWPQTVENEPERAIQALDDVRHGRFSGLVPAHLFTQVWKTQRCIHHQEGKGMIPLELDFIGHLENLDQDWQFVEKNLMVPHIPLPVIHSSDTAKERVAAKEMLKFDPVSDTKSRFAKLTRRVCDYYRNDFVCFGYMKEMAICH
jgi:hypothetical protein